VRQQNELTIGAAPDVWKAWVTKPPG
jgi:hypothetical protein